MVLHCGKKQRVDECRYEQARIFLRVIKMAFLTSSGERVTRSGVSLIRHHWKKNRLSPPTADGTASSILGL